MNSSNRLVSSALTAVWFLLGCSVFLNSFPTLATTESVVSKPTAFAFDKETLRRWRDRFNNLTTDHQTRMRDIHRTVTTSENSDRLQLILMRYTDWLKSLSSAQRAALLEMAPDKRVAEVKRLKRDQAKRHQVSSSTSLAPHRISRQDRDAIKRWFQNVYVANHQQEIYDILPNWVVEEIRNDEHKRTRHQAFRLMTQIGRHTRKGSLPPPTETEFATLYSELSNDATKLLRAAKNNRARVELVRQWIGLAMKDAYRRAEPHPEALENFINNLSDEEHRRVRRLPHEQRRREMIRLFMQRPADADAHEPGFPPRDSGDGEFLGPRGGRPGGRRGPKPPPGGQDRLRPPPRPRKGPDP